MRSPREKMAVYAAFVTIFGLALAASLEQPHYDLDHSRELFEEFIATYKKSYVDELEHELRHTIFRKNLKRINDINAASPTSVHAVNQFADLSVKEFSSMYTGFRPDQGSQENWDLTEALKFDGDVPEDHDWRKKGVVTSIKNQRECGACWAFSSVANVESQYALKHNLSLVDLSPQQLVDCDDVNLGCDGGFLNQGYDYFMKAGGAMTLADYPYVGERSQCMFDKSKVKAKVTDKKLAKNMTEDDLKILLYKNGPLAVAINSYDMSAYDSGISQPTPASCVPMALDHAVTLVGYGVEMGVKFWVIKNSWGTLWGEEGYYRLVRGRGACGVNLYIASATVE